MYLVAGMHRSGTSMTTLALNAMGAPVGDPQDMIGADYWNKSGYFENKDAVVLNLRLMLGVDIDPAIWLDPPVEPFARLTSLITSPKWRYLLPRQPGDIERRAEQLQAELQAFSQKNTGIFVKDPRFSITHRAWSEYAEIEGVVLPFRNPASVAKSIEKRDLIPSFVALNMWKRYNLEYLRSVDPDMPLLLVDYDRFFDEGSDEYMSDLVACIGERVGKDLDEDGPSGVINKKERHHAGTPIEDQAKSVRSDYARLKEASAGRPSWMTAQAVTGL